MRKSILFLFVSSFLFTSCAKYFDKDFWNDKVEKFTEDASTFEEIGYLDIGEAGAAEISAYDPQTKRLFVVNNSNTNRIDVLDMSDPSSMRIITSIELAKYQGAVNSVDVHDGLLAAALEAANKQENGKVVVFRTIDYSEVKVIPAGALPDMVTFSPDGKFILTANEGEPSADYSVDPLGTVTLISVKDGFSPVQLDFSEFASKEQDLKMKGLRRFGPGASFAMDMEPEYVTVSKDSKNAWVTLQENNAIARIDLQSKKITDIFPLGFKNYNLNANAIDPSDRDDMIAFRTVPAFGMYQPDAIAVLEKRNIPYLFTANEGDVREYDGFEEAERLADIELNTTSFPNAEWLQQPENAGRLNITKTLGDEDGDGKYEAIFSFGARSFSVWNGYSGDLVYDSKNNLEEAVDEAGMYEDGRSDDKGVEPEGIAVGEVGLKDIAFVGMERVDAVAVYDVTDPQRPSLLKILRTGDAPEGILFVHASESPTGKSLLIVSSEDDGVVKVYSTSH